MTLVLIAASITVMVVGTHLVVTGTVSIAGRLGMSKRFTGLAIVAVGTSLPEIASTVTAVCNNEHKLAIGNVMGSCFFNIVAVPAVMALRGTAGLSINDAALAVNIPVMLLAVIACLPVFLVVIGFQEPKACCFWFAAAPISSYFISKVFRNHSCTST